MAYKIDVEAVGQYIEYLRKFKKQLEKDLADFDKDLKNAHQHWDDNNYTLTVEAKDEVAAQQRKLIEAINKSLKKLTQMHEEYEKYLRRR